MKIPAYAKINLFLDVKDLRDDGFHNIKSVMHSVTLCDYVSLEKGDSNGKKSISVAVIGNNNLDVPLGPDNLVYKAAEAFFKFYSIREYSVNFTIEKNIPVSAGLAGGSSDAAAALMLLSKKYDTEKKELYAIAEKIGSDVPFCIMGGVCITEGRGEALTPIESDIDLDFVICKAGQGISTPAAYKALDIKFDKSLCSPRGDMHGMINAICRKDKIEISEKLYNIFEEVVLPIRCEARILRSLMMREGAIGSLLSGSGPSVFGIFNSSDDAHNAAEKLKKLGFNPYVCSSAFISG